MPFEIPHTAKFVFLPIKLILLQKKPSWLTNCNKSMLAFSNQSKPFQVTTNFIPVLLFLELPPLWTLSWPQSVVTEFIAEAFFEQRLNICSFPVLSHHFLNWRRFLKIMSNSSQFPPSSPQQPRMLSKLKRMIDPFYGQLAFLVPMNQILAPLSRN